MKRPELERRNSIGFDLSFLLKIEVIAIGLEMFSNGRVLALAHTKAWVLSLPQRLYKLNTVTHA